MTLRPLFVIFAAVAMLFTPLAMQGGSAMAAAPADHHSQMVEEDHCGGEPAQDQGGKSTEMPCCAAMCIAVAVEPASAAAPLALSAAVQRPSVAESPHSYLAEFPTPPPRRA